MPRNVNGTYVLPAGNPVVPGTLIESTWANPTMSDLGNEITLSLPRNGSAPMTGPLILSHDAVLAMEPVSKQQFEASLNATNSYMPAGVIQAFAFSTVPTGWLECNGTAVSRTTYANLFATIGTTYGVGNGVTTFNLPDLRGEFIRGFDNGRSVDPARPFGSNQGAANNPHNHTLTDPTHAHSASQAAHSHGVNDPGHIHHVNLGAGTAGVNAGADPAPLSAGSDTFSSITGITIANSQPPVTVNSAGTGISIAPEGVEARPRNVAMMYCIKAFGALQTDGLGSMAFQNKETVNILGGSGAFTTLSCTTAPVNPNDVARLADIGGSIAEVFSSDISMLLVDNTDPSNPILRPQANVPNGMVKLDANGKVPSALMDPTGYNYQGPWDASGGLLPGGVHLDGSLYYISIAGSLDLFHEDGLEHATICAIGTRIVYVTESPTLPVPNWYYEPPSLLSGATASQVSFLPSGDITANDVQAAIEELDAEKATAAQGALADTALQPADIGVSVQPYDVDTVLSDAVQTLTNKRYGIGSSGTASQNFTITAEDANGTMKLARGIPGATTQDLITVSATNMVTGGNGAVLVGNGPAFSAYQTAAQSLSSVASKVLFQTELFDTANAFAGSTFTVPVTGYYQFCGAVRWGDFSSNNTLYIRVNNVDKKVLVQNTNNAVNIPWSDFRLLTAGDTVDIWAIQAVTANTTPLLESMFFSGFLARSA